MNHKITRLLSLFFSTLACFIAPVNTPAQESPEAKAARQAEKPAPEVVRDQTGKVSIAVGRGLRINVGNRTTGPIIVIGWDRDTIEASATSDRGAEHVRVIVDPNPSGLRIALKADYAEESSAGLRLGHELLEQVFSRMKEERYRPAVKPPQAPPVPPTQAPDVSPIAIRPGEIFFEVKVPRYAEIELIEVYRSNVLVSGVETGIAVSGDRSEIKLKDVGAAEVRTSSGPVEVDQAKGLIDVITTSGAIAVKNAGGDVRALSISGKIEIQCAHGRVDVSNTDASITLTGINGDVTAMATNSSVRLSGSIRADGRYHLKSMSGTVEMEIPANSPGFTAALSSYRGGIGTDFPLKTNKPAPTSQTNQRLIGRYGNGQAQITLDSFDGAVKLGKVSVGALKECR
jgi:hypothetical protein